MTGCIHLTPDELAKLVGDSVERAGLPRAVVLSIRREGQLVSYDQVDITYEMPDGLPDKRVSDAAALRQALYPSVWGAGGGNGG